MILLAVPSGNNAIQGKLLEQGYRVLLAKSTDELWKLLRDSRLRVCIFCMREETLPTWQTLAREDVITSPIRFVVVLEDSRLALDGLELGPRATALVTLGPHWPEKLRLATETATQLAEQIETNKSWMEDVRELGFVLGHEIRGTLRTLSNCQQLLIEGDRLTPTQRETIGYVEDAAARVNRLVERLSSYLDAVSGKPRRALRSKEEILHAEFALDAQLRATEAVVVHEALPDAAGEPGSLRTVFQELIENSLRFRGPEAPVVRVTAEEDGEDWIRFRVSDNGLGFDPTLAPRLGHLGQRLHGRDLSGPGVGLAICRRIIERHGGQLSIESTPGLGTTVSFTWPQI